MEDWTDVNTELPKEDNCYVLVACEGGNVSESFYSTNRDFLKCEGSSYSRKVQGKNSGFFALCHKYGYKITHWMNKPKHPKEK